MSGYVALMLFLAAEFIAVSRSYRFNNASIGVYRA